MTTADARTAAKQLLDIASLTTFDSILDGFAAFAVKRLYPLAQREVPALNVSVTPSNGRAEINLGALTPALVGVRRLEVSSSYDWDDHTNYYSHGGVLRVDELDGAVGTVRIYGLARYTIDNLDAEFEQAVVYYIVASFFQYLLGNKRKFNIYTQSAGARSADDMRDQAVYYENLANTYLSDRATMYGAS